MKNGITTLKFSEVVKYDNFLALFAFFLPISEKLSTLLIGLSVIILIIEVIRGEVTFKLDKELLLLPTLYLIYVAVSTIMSAEIQFKWFENKASLLVFPLLFSTSRKIDLKRILPFFVYGCLTAYVICLLFAINSSMVIDGSDFYFSPMINDKRGFFESMVYEGNYFFGVQFSSLIQISYFALYIALAMAALLFLLEDFKGKKITVFIFSIAILQISSLAGILNLITVILLAIIYKLKSKRKKMAIFFGLLVLVVLSALYHPRINNTIKGVYKTIHGEDSPLYPKQPRLITWEAAIRAIGENGIYGVGIGNSQRELNKKYKEIGYEKGSRENLNTHNQYLQILLECGVLGLATLLFILCVLLKKVIHDEAFQRPFVLCFFLLIAISFMFESILNRYIGISFFAFFVSLVFAQSKK